MHDAFRLVVIERYGVAYSFIHSFTISEEVIHREDHEEHLDQKSSQSSEKTQCLTGNLTTRSFETRQQELLRTKLANVNVTSNVIEDRSTEFGVGIEQSINPGLKSRKCSA